MAKYSTVPSSSKKKQKDIEDQHTFSTRSRSSGTTTAEDVQKYKSIVEKATNEQSNQGKGYSASTVYKPGQEIKASDSTPWQNSLGAAQKNLQRFQKMPEQYRNKYLDYLIDNPKAAMASGYTTLELKRLKDQLTTSRASGSALAQQAQNPSSAQTLRAPSQAPVKVGDKTLSSPWAVQETRTSSAANNQRIDKKAERIKSVMKDDSEVAKMTYDQYRKYLDAAQKVLGAGTSYALRKDYTFDNGTTNADRQAEYEYYKNLNRKASSAYLRGEKEKQDEIRDEAAKDLIEFAELNYPLRTVRTGQYTPANVDELVARLEAVPEGNGDGALYARGLSDPEKVKQYEDLYEKYQVARAKSARVDEDLLYSDAYEGPEETRKEVTSRPDFQQNSTYTPDEEHGTFLGGTYGKDADIIDFLNKYYVSPKDRANRNAILANSGLDVAPSDRSEYITDEDAKIVAYLYNSGDAVQARRYIEQVTNRANLEYTSRMQQVWAEEAAANPARAYAQNRGDALLQGVLFPVQQQVAKQMGSAAVFAPAFETNQRYQAKEAAIVQKIRAVSDSDEGKWFDKNIGEKVGTSASQLTEFLYTTGSNIVDNLIRDFPARVTGIKDFMDVALLVMGSQAASNTLFQDLSKGDSYYNAVQHAVFDGMTEYLTERVGGEYMFEGVNGNNYPMYVLKGAGSEGVEEYMGGIAGMAYDSMAHDPHSEHTQNTLQKYEDNTKVMGLPGEETERHLMSWSEAENKVSQEELKDIAKQMVSAGLSVGVTGTANYGVAAAQNARVRSKMQQNANLNEQISKNAAEIKDLQQKIESAQDEAQKASLQQQLDEKVARGEQMTEEFKKRGKQITKAVQKMTDEEVGYDYTKPAAEQSSEVIKGDLGDGKTIQTVAKDGNIVTSDGTEMKAPEVDWDAMPKTKDLYDKSMEAAREYGVAPGVIYGSYDARMDVEDYIQGVRDIASTARYRGDLAELTAKNQYAAAIAPSMAQAIYNQAAESGDTWTQAQVAKAQNLRALNPGNADVTYTPEAEAMLAKEGEGSKLKDSVRDTSIFLNGLGLGVDYFVSEADETGKIITPEQGSINADATRIRIDLNAGKGNVDDMVTSAILQVAAHEMTHGIATRNPEGFRALTKAVGDVLASRGESLDQYARRRMAAYKEATKGKEMSLDQAMEEVVAQASERVLGDSKYAQEVAEKSPSLAQSIRDFFRKFAQRIKKLLSDGKYLSETSLAMSKSMDKIAKVWDDAVRGINAEGTGEGQESAEEIPQGERFAMREPVEQVGDLVAVHNITEQNLKTALDRGGFPGPSIAILKAKMGHTDFGPISVVFRASTIDPEADTRNVVFGGDAWTPSYPRVSKNLSPDKVAEVNIELNKHVDNIPIESVRKSAKNFVLKHASEIEQAGGTAYFGDYFFRSRDTGLIALFAAQQSNAKELFDEANKAGGLPFLQSDGLRKIVMQKYAPEFFAWLDSLGEKLDTKKYLKSRIGTLYEDTPENAVKVMFERGNRNTAGPDAVASTMRRYNSLDQIREDKNRLPDTQDERLGIYDKEHEIDSELSDAVNDLMRVLERVKQYPSFAELQDMVYRVIGQANDTGETIESVLKEALDFAHYNGYEKGEAGKLFRQVVSTLEDINARSQQNMTKYFEAKPERVVGLDEVAAVIYPDDVSDSIKEALAYKDIEAFEYMHDDREDRIERLNGVSEFVNARFSLRQSDADYMAAVERGDMETAQRMVDEAAERAFANSKIRAEDGKLLKVYHGSDEDFTVFDRTKGRANMDIQGMFFSPWEEDAGGYGRNVRAFYLNITNPAAEGAGYKALNAHKGQNGAGISAREDLIRMGYDGVNNYDEEYIAFNPEQIKSADPVTYDDDGNVIPLSERFNPEEGDIRYSLRTESEMSDREVLGEAMKEVANGRTEAMYLDRYQQTYYDLTKNERELRNQRRIMRKSDEGSEEYRAAKNRADIYQKRVADKTAALEKLEQDPRFAVMAQRERDRAEAAVARDFETGAAIEQEREELIRGYEKKLRDRRLSLEEYKRGRRESADRSRYIERITDTAKDLSEMLASKTDKKHVPDALAGPLSDFLGALNLYSKRSNAGGKMTQKDLKLSQLLNHVKDAAQQSESLGNLNRNGDYAGSLYLPQGFFDTIAALARNMENLEVVYRDADPIVNMSVENLRVLDQTIRTLKRAIQDVNKTFANASYAKVEDMSRKSILHLNGLGPASKRQGDLKRYLQWSMATPVYAFDRFGDVGKSLFKEISKGYGERAQRLYQIEQYAASKWSAKEARSWDNHVRTFNFEHTSEDGGKTTVNVDLTDSQIMSIYLLMNRGQGRQHALTGGIRAKDVLKGSKVLISQPEAAHLTEEEIRSITSTLSDRQIEVCKAISDFMKTTSDWGNEVSMRRFGYRAFGEANYFPIETDEFSRAGMPENKGQGNNLYRLMNMTFTKALNPHANNALVVDSIFSVFASHATDMATYSTMALPALDIIRWYNYHAKLDDGTLISTRGSMARAYGNSADQYVRYFISDFSGSTRTSERGEEHKVLGKVMSHSKRASVAANLSVVLKQPGSILRAAYVLPRAAYHRPTAVVSKATYEEMLEHSGIARWKSMGYFDTNLAKPMEDRISKGQSKGDKLLDLTTKGAEWMDRSTMVSIWSAAKAQIAHDNPNMDRTSKEYYQKVTDLFEDVIYRTQVVDSTMTRSQSMRNPGFLGKVMNAFQAEPTLSYNVLMDSLTKAWEEHRQGRKAITRKTGGRMAIAAVTFVGTGLIEALVSSIMSAYRDDDDYESFFDKFKQLMGSNILENLNPVNSMPLVKYLIDQFSGDSSTIVDSGFTNLAYAFQNLKKVFWKDGKFNENWEDNLENNWMQLVRYAVSAASYLSGLPAYNAAREAWSAWNTVMDATGNYQLKYHPYSDKGSNVSKVGMYYDALRAGDQAEIARLKSVMENAGLTGEKFEDAFGKIVKSEFLAGALSDEEAIDMLTKELGLPETGTKSAYYKVQKWAWDQEEAQKKDKEEGEDAQNFGIKAHLKEALIQGDPEAIEAAIQELKDHYGKSDKEAESLRAECINELRKSGQLDFETSVSLLIGNDTSMAGAETEADFWRTDEQKYKLETANDPNAPAYHRFNRLDPYIDSGKEIPADVMMSYGFANAADIAKYCRTHFSERYKAGEITRSELEAGLKQYGQYADPNDWYWKAEEAEYKLEHPDGSYSYTGRLIEAMDGGSDLTTTVKLYTDHGKKPDNINRDVSKYYKPLWQAGNANTRTAIQSKMMKLWKALGYTDLDDRLEALKKSWAK